MSRSATMTAIDISRLTFGICFVHNDRLIDALMAQAFPALQASAGAQALLRPPTRPWRQLQLRVAPARQPARRHPAGMPQDWHTLRRGNRLVAPPQPGRCLKFKLLGCPPRHRGAAGRARCRGRSRHGLPVGAAVRTYVSRTRPASRGTHQPTAGSSTGRTSRSPACVFSAMSTARSTSVGRSSTCWSRSVATARRHGGSSNKRRPP
jgi:hypothetical protein